MAGLIYRAGRVFQMIGLALMPSALWVGELARDEKKAIALFVASLLIFTLGTGLARFAKPS